MIKNERQYKITKKALDDWRKTCKQLSGARVPRMPKWVHEAQIESAKTEVLQLEKQLKEYETLRAGKGKMPDLSLVDEISNWLVKWRIRCNLTQRELATLADMPEQQIQRYEETNYQSASLSTVGRIAHALREYRPRRRNRVVSA